MLFDMQIRGMPGSCAHWGMPGSCAHMRSLDEEAQFRKPVGMRQALCCQAGLRLAREGKSGYAFFRMEKH
jgi:hypothetical protein